MMDYRLQMAVNPDASTVYESAICDHLLGFSYKL
jgi:hypothetical protein